MLPYMKDVCVFDSTDDTIAEDDIDIDDTCTNGYEHHLRNDTNLTESDTSEFYYDPMCLDEGEYQAAENCEDVEVWSCDTCDKEFTCSYEYEKHMSYHKTCGIDGCTFTAHEKLIEKHVQMQHASGLYKKICNVSTPEDVQKWIEERKRRFATRKNVENKIKEREELAKRGVRIQDNENKFGKDSKRLELVKRNRVERHPRKRFNNKRKQNQIVTQPKDTNYDIVPKKSLIDDKFDWNGPMFPFRGTAGLICLEKIADENPIDDDEWVQPENKEGEKDICLPNALGFLMEAYNSDEFENEDSHVKSVVRNSVPDPNNCAGNSDDEPPEEVKNVNFAPDTNLDTNICNAKCDLATLDVASNSSRKRSRKALKNGVKIVEQNQSTDTRVKRVPEKPAFKKRRVTLLEKLLKNEIRHERNVILQCVKFVVDNNFLQD